MFAKLKKKIEEEVGDLGQLTSQVTNTFGGGDRRVSSGGGSSQGTNTPNNLGSRQSSMASLVDLHPIDENQPMVTTPTSKNPPSFAHHLTPLSPQSSVTPNSGPPTARSTSNYIASVQQKAMENYEAELKRVNNEWSKKLDAQKKTFEEKLQNQEADFAWKYSTKEDEIEKLRVEKRKLEETVKNVEGIYQSKITRAHDDIDQLEGYTKQEMAKVKHLLLNAQADLQQVQGELFQSEIKLKDLTEENQNLKSENDNLLKNLNKLEFGTGKTVKTLEEQLEELRNKAASLELEIDEKNKRLDSLFGINEDLQSKHEAKDESLKQLQIELRTLREKVASELEAPSKHNELINSSEQIQILRSQNDDLLAKLTNVTSKCEEEKAKADSLLNNLEAEKSKHDQIEAEHAKISKELDEEKSNFEAFKVRNEAQIEKLTAQNATYEADGAAYVVELKELREKLAQCSADANSRDEGADELKVALSEIGKLRDENNSLQKSLSEQKVKFESELESNTSELNELRGKLLILESDVQTKQQNDGKLNDIGEELQRLKAENDTLSKHLREEHDRFREQLKDLQQVQEELFQSEIKVKDLTEENQIQKSENDNLLKNLKDLEVATAKTVKTLDELRSKASSLELEIDEKNKRLNSLSEINQGLQSKHETKNESLKQLKIEVSTLREKIEASEMETSNKDKELASLSEQIQNLRPLNDELLAKLTEMTSKYEMEKTKNDEVLMKLNSEYTKTEMEKGKADSFLKDLEMEKSKQDKIKADYEKVLDELSEEKSNFEAFKATTEAQLEKLNAQNATYEADSIAYVTELKELREKLVQCSSDAKSRNEYEDELKLALDEIEKLNNENDSLQKSLSDEKVKFDSEMKANTFELNVLREKLLMFESDVETKQENDGKLNDVAEELHRLKAENDMLSKSLREEKVKFRKQMKDHASAINELKGKMREEPAVIQSSNSHHTEASNNYTEDVNFQYMRSVLFKFITTSDPQVTKHLTKAVATLLHLNDEEGRLLQKSADKRIKSWFPVGGEHLS